MKWTENGITFEATAKEFLEVWNTIHPAPVAELKPRKRPEITVIGHAGDEHKFATKKDAAKYLSLATQRIVTPISLAHRKSNTLYVKDYMSCDKAWDPSQTPDTEIPNIPQGE